MVEHEIIMKVLISVIGSFFVTAVSYAFDIEWLRNRKPIRLGLMFITYTICIITLILLATHDKMGISIKSINATMTNMTYIKADGLLIDGYYDNNCKPDIYLLTHRIENAKDNLWQVTKVDNINGAHCSWSTKVYLDDLKVGINQYDVIAVMTEPQSGLLKNHDSITFPVDKIPASKSDLLHINISEVK